MAKGVEYRPVPKEWYDWKANKIDEVEDDEDTIKAKQFNLDILANKKPYFMIYNYDKLKREYNEYYRANEMACLANFGMTIEELRDKKDKTEVEQEMYNTFAQQCPVNVSPSVINRIAWHIEKHFADKDLFSISTYDTEKLKTKGVEYSTQMYNKVKALRLEHREAQQELIKNSKSGYVDDESKTMANTQLLNTFIEKTFEVCGDEMVACNVLVDLCYSDNKSKDLLWQACGSQLIKNMVDNGYKTLRFPVKAEGDGEFTFKGYNFEMKEVDADEINW